jgi:hypothetical protein
MKWCSKSEKDVAHSEMVVPTGFEPVFESRTTFAIYFGQFAYATHPRRSCQKVGKWKLGGDLFGHFYSVYEHGSPVHRRHQLRMFEPAERLFGD